MRAHRVAERGGDSIYVDRGQLQPHVNDGTGAGGPRPNLDTDGPPAVRDDLTDGMPVHVRDGERQSHSVVAVAVTVNVGYLPVFVTVLLDVAGPDIDSLNVAVIDSERHGTDQSLADTDRFRNR